MKLLAPLVLLLALGAVVVAVAALGDPPHGSDSLFYESQVEEVRGATAQEGRAEWFGGAEARRTAGIEDRPEHVVRTLDPAWVDFSSQFYRRRWVVPLLGAAVDPIAGGERLRVVSLAGYLLIGPLLFLLLRRRFGVGTSLAVSGASMLLPPLIEAANSYGVDTCGLAIELACFLFLVLAVERGLRWLPPFALAMLVLAFTRDNALALLAGLAWLAWRERGDPSLRRRNGLLLASGVAASAPALILFRAPLRPQIAWAQDNYALGGPDGWGHVLASYPLALAKYGYFDLRYVTEHAFSPLAVPLLALMLAVLAAAVAWLLARSPREDPYFDLMRGSLAGCLVLMVLAATYSRYRIELVLLPAVAVGAAHGLQTLRQQGLPRPSFALAQRRRRRA